MFSPWGLGSPIDETSSADYIQALVSLRELSAAVPDDLKRDFEVVRSLHVYGLFVYEFFTVAAHYAQLVIEGSLQARFMKAHRRGVVLIHPRHPRLELQLAHYDTLQAHLGLRGSHDARRGWGIECSPEFDGRFRSLFEWARLNGLLSSWLNPIWDRAFYGIVGTEFPRLDAERRIPAEYGKWSVEQRERWWRINYRAEWEVGYIENTIALRNLAGHPDAGTVLTPITSATAIEHLAAILNSLFASGTDLSS